MYLFAGQIALVVLTGTAISFISFMLNKKVYAFTIKELLMYKYRWYNNNFGELVIMNFLLLFLSIPLLYIFYSELLCIILFILSLIITYKIIKVISNVFFDDQYLLDYSKRILLHEFDSANSKKWHKATLFFQKFRKSDDAIVDEYSHIYRLFQRLRKHTEEALDKMDIDTYRENVDLVSILSLRNETKVIQNIMNSVEFGVFFRDVGEMLYKRELKDELKLLIMDNNIQKNCNPKNLCIDNIRVAEMFSSHYSNAINSNLKLYTKLCLGENEYFELSFTHELDVYLKSFNYVYSISQDMDNPIYERMNYQNWCGLMVRLGVKMWKGEGSTQLISDYMKRLIINYFTNDIEWSIEVINSLLKQCQKINWSDFVSEIINKFEGEKLDRFINNIELEIKLSE